MSSRKRIQNDESYSSRVITKERQDYEKALFQIQSNSHSRSLSKRLIEEQKEREIEECLRKVAEEKQKRSERLHREQEAAHIELNRIRGRYNEEKMRQQIRENNQELRELESKLRTAYVSKALSAQKKEREALMLAERIREKEEIKVLEEARLSHLEQMKRDEEKKCERQKQLREDLQSQITTAHKQHQRLYEEFLREKYYLDEIAKRVQEELLELSREKIERKEKTKKEMEAFKIVKQELERLQQIEREEENQRILKYCEQRDAKIEAEEKRQQELEKNRENLNEKMVTELSELMQKKNLREEVLQELWAFEQNEKVEQKIRDDLERRFRIRVETRIALEEQLIDRQKRREQEAQDDKLFWEKQMEMLAERDKIDQLSNEKRRRKMAEHRRAIHDMLDERKAQRAIDILNEMKQRDLDQQREKRKQEIIEEERIRIIQEHAEALLGFLPPGVLRDTDRQYLSIIPEKYHH